MGGVVSPSDQILKSILSLKYELILPAKRAWSHLVFWKFQFISPKSPLIRSLVEGVAVWLC